MTRQETQDFLVNLIATYPTFKYEGTPTVEAWWHKLGDVSVADATKALDKYFDKGNKYPPTLADIVGLLQKSNSRNDGWGYEVDEYGFEYVVKGSQRRSIRLVYEDTYEDKDGYLWAIR